MKYNPIQVNNLKFDFSTEIVNVDELTPEELKIMVE